MKINFVIPFKRLSGGIRVVFLYANYLVGKGHDVVCYMPMVSYKGKDQSALFRLKASLSNTFKPEHWFDAKFKLKIVPVIKPKFIRDADVTIATAWQTAYDVKKLPHRCGKKVYFVQDYEVFNGEAKDVDRSYQLGLHTITITRQLAQMLKERFGVDAEVIYNGLDQAEFIAQPKKKHKSPVLLMMYHEAEHKGTKPGMELVENLRKKYPDLRLNMFGRRKGSDVPEYARFLENPPRELLMKMYRESDIYLFTSSREAWGLPILEAMANKCAVVGFKVGAMAEIATDQNAVVIENFNFSQMEVEVEKLLNDRQRLLLLQYEAYKTALQFTWETQYAHFEDYLDKLAEYK